MKSLNVLCVNDTGGYNTQKFREELIKALEGTGKYSLDESREITVVDQEDLEEECTDFINYSVSEESLTIVLNNSDTLSPLVSWKHTYFLDDMGNSLTNSVLMILSFSFNDLNTNAYSTFVDKAIVSENGVETLSRENFSISVLTSVIVANAANATDSYIRENDEDNVSSNPETYYADLSDIDAAIKQMQNVPTITDSGKTSSTGKRYFYMNKIRVKK
jgi:hypothetical protein